VLNKELKERFLSNYDESTQQSLTYIFQRANELEEMLGKDIYEFNRDELHDLFMSFGSRSEVSVASRISIINKYIDYAIEQGFVPTGINLVKNFVGQEYYKKYISKVAEKKKILSKEEVYALTVGSESFCINAQDAAIILLPFIGVRGRQIQDNPLEEMRNLKWENVDEANNSITLTRNDGDKIIAKRTINNIDPKIIEILKDAYNQEKYLKNNGEVTDWMIQKKNTEIELLNTGYILRTTKKGENGRISNGTISQRLNTIRELYGNPFINVTNLWLSGMVEYGKQIKKEKGEALTGDDYREICRRFGQEEVYYSKIKQRIEKYI
jgi:integrase